MLKVLCVRKPRAWKEGGRWNNMFMIKNLLTKVTWGRRDVWSLSLAHQVLVLIWWCFSGWAPREALSSVSVLWSLSSCFLLEVGTSFPSTLRWENKCGNATLLIRIKDMYYHYACSLILPVFCALSCEKYMEKCPSRSLECLHGISLTFKLLWRTVFIHMEYKSLLLLFFPQNCTSIKKEIEILL